MHAVHTMPLLSHWQRHNHTMRLAQPLVLREKGTLALTVDCSLNYPRPLVRQEVDSSVNTFDSLFSTGRALLHTDRFACPISYESRSQRSLTRDRSLNSGFKR